MQNVMLASMELRTEKAHSDISKNACSRLSPDRYTARAQLTENVL
jgi:hypothetical protein